MLKLGTISTIKVQAPRDILGNQKYHINLEAYLPHGIIPLDLIQLFDKTPRMLKLPILNASTNYESIPRGTLPGTFKPGDEEITCPA